MGLAMLGRLRLILVALVVTFTPAHARTPQQDSSYAQALRQEAETLRSLDMEEASARAPALANLIERQIATTSDRIEWASLHVSLAIVHTASPRRLASAPEPDPAVPMSVYGPMYARAHAALDAALTVLTRENAPLEWARAYQQRAEIYLQYTVVGNNAARIEPLRAAQAAALSVFTRANYPRQYLEIRCHDLWHTPPDTDAQLTESSRNRLSAFFTQRYDVKTMVLNATCGSNTATTDASFSNQFYLIRSVAYSIRNANENRAVESDAKGADIVDQINQAHAAILSASLSLEQIGLSDADRLRAYALRSRADELDRLIPDGQRRLDNTEMWRTRAELFDLVVSARFPDRAQSLSLALPVLAPVVIDAQNGFVAVKPPSGNGALISTLSPWAQTWSESFPRSFEVENEILAARRAAGNNASVTEQRLTPAEQERYNARSREFRAAHETALRASLGVHALDQWSPLYAAGEYRRAIQVFREQYEGAWSTALRTAAERGGAAPGGRILIMPDAASSALPLGVLRDGATGRALLEDYEITYVPSLSVYATAEARARMARPPSVATFALDSDTLPFAPVEEQIVNAAFNAARPALGAPLTQRLRSASYWHLATHASFDPQNPRRSGLDLGQEGRLTVGDLYAAAEPMGFPRLVVLSACETGLFDAEHDPDQFIGLATGFILAGASGVVVSLWPVPDSSTTLLMAKFYDLHLDAGQRPSLALRNAQLWLKSASHADLNTFVEDLEARGRVTADQADALLGAVADAEHEAPFSDPYYWGAWVFYGA